MSFPIKNAGSFRRFVYVYQAGRRIEAELISMTSVGWPSPLKNDGVKVSWDYELPNITHRIHGAGIYAHIWSILMVNVTIYSIHGSYG